jgi:hypothetical protein
VETEVLKSVTGMLSSPTEIYHVSEERIAPIFRIESKQQVDLFTLKMEALSSSETSVNIYGNVWCYILEDSIRNVCFCNLKVLSVIQNL